MALRGIATFSVVVHDPPLLSVTVTLIRYTRPEETTRYSARSRSCLAVVVRLASGQVVSPAPVTGWVWVTEVIRYVIDSPSGSVAPLTVTGKKLRFIDGRTSGFATTVEQSGGLLNSTC